MKTHTTIVPAICLLAVGALGSAPVSAAPGHVPAVFVKKEPGISARIDAVLQRAHEEERFSGTVLVRKGDKTLLEKGYGMADAARHHAITPQTRFRLPGLTPIISSVAAVQLQEHGKLNLQDSMCKYLSPCPATWHSITLRELLNGTSGIFDPQSQGSRVNLSQIRTIGDFLAEAASHPLQFAPGTRASNGLAGSVALIPVIEKASGEQFTSYLQDHMFRPLGMTHTGVHKLRDTWTAALDGVYSTVDDLYRWDQSVLGCGIVSPESLFWALEPGRGISTVVQGHHMVQVVGTRGAASAGDRYLPEDDVTIIVLANNGGNIRSLLDSIQTAL
jgi:CubicO group peptidase (beta-lactamase class C family)